VRHPSRRQVRYSAAFGLLICSSLVVLLPSRAQAQFTGTAAATAQFESNSNVFDTGSGVAPPRGDTSHRADTDFGYGALLNGNYLWGRQQFFVNANAHEYVYQRTTQFTHDEYSLDVGLNWKLGDSWEGKLDVSRSRTKVPQYDLTGEVRTLAVLTSQQEMAYVDYKVSSDWKVDASVSSSKGEQPIAGEPDLDLKQTVTTTSVNYVGIAGFSTGLSYGYLSGNYGGSTVATSPNYTQQTLSYVATYKISRMTLGGSLGYSRRTSGSGPNNAAGLTGSLDLEYQLTPKTSFSATLARTINNFYLNTSSEIDTVAGLGINWKATYKLTASLSYTFTYRDYPGQGPNTVTGDRVDIQQYVNAALTYEPRRWLSIKPYASFQTRRSTAVGADFNGSVIGVSLTVTPISYPK